MRLDQYLVANKLANSRNEAVKMIQNHLVYVDYQLVNKNNIKIVNQHVEVLGELKFVSRAGLKLSHAIEEFKIDVSNKCVLDLGSSTGGFADVCLQLGAKCVFCIDVGIDQLHAKIKNDSRIINLEKTNIKSLDKKIIPINIDLVVSDLSFISSKYMFEAIKQLSLKPGCDIISLIKPQFELSKSIIDSCNAKITDSKYHLKAIDNVKTYAIQNQLKIIKVIESPILGAKKQNKEFLIWCKNEQ